MKLSEKSHFYSSQYYKRGIPCQTCHYSKKKKKNLAVKFKIRHLMLI